MISSKSLGIDAEGQGVNAYDSSLNNLILYSWASRLPTPIGYDCA